jgi:Transposase domain (DUF772)
MSLVMAIIRSSQDGGSAGRKPLDAIVMFRMLVLQALNNLSEEQAE